MPREATGLQVCLFDDDGAETAHDLTEHSLGVWHGALPGIAVGTLYGYRADGPWVPDLGLRFNRHKLLLDPYAQAVSGDVTTDPAIFGHLDDTPGRDEARSTPRRTCRAASSSTPPSTGAATGRCSGGGGTPRSTRCTSRA